MDLKFLYVVIKMVVEVKEILKFKKFESTRVILEFPKTEIYDKIDFLKNSLSPGFPRDFVNTGVPPTKSPRIPRLILRSKSSQVQISNAHVEFGVNYFGNFADDYSLCEQYTKNKIKYITDAFIGNICPYFDFLAIVNSLRLSFGGLSGSPIPYLYDTFFKLQTGIENIQDLEFRLALKKDNKFFVNYTLKNYETREVKITPPPGGGYVPIKPFEGEVVDRGVNIILDINTKLALQEKQVAEYSAQDIDKLFVIMKTQLEEGSLDNLLLNSTI